MLRTNIFCVCLSETIMHFMSATIKLNNFNLSAAKKLGALQRLTWEGFQFIYTCVQKLNVMFCLHFWGNFVVMGIVRREGSAGYFLCFTLCSVLQTLSTGNLRGSSHRIDGCVGGKGGAGGCPLYLLYSLMSYMYAPLPLPDITPHAGWYVQTQTFF